MHVFYSGDSKPGFSEPSVNVRQALRVTAGRTASLALRVWISSLASVLKHGLSLPLELQDEGDEGMKFRKVVVGMYEGLRTVPSTE